jgi:DNA-binding beta-propeller fold protein YncE
MYYDQPNKHIIVGDRENLRVLQFSLNNPSSHGTVIAGGNGGGCGLNQFRTVVGIAVDSSGQLYVAASTCAQILKFPADLNSSTFGVRISYLNGPEGMLINPPSDDLYVAVYSDNYVVKFSKNSTGGVVIAGA